MKQLFAPIPKGLNVSTTTVTSHEAPASKTAPSSYASCTGMRHFRLRRVHSAFGLFFGGYITVHLLVNATGLKPLMYQQNVDKIHQLEPLLPFIEIAAIFLPLIVHVVYGLYIARVGVQFNTTKYNYGGNIRYTLQRVTAVILLLFVGYHIGTMHKWGLGAFGVKGFPAFNPENLAYQSTVSAIRYPFGLDQPVLNGLIIAFYLLGVWSAVFHWANGLWTSAIAWGLTITEKSQKRWGHVCCGFGIAMLVVGTVAWAAFAFGDAKYPESKTTTMPPHESAMIYDQATSLTPSGEKKPGSELKTDNGIIKIEEKK
jgi:succinate dehydrogenase / fumarate reductase cytochrome b subunit